ncbi:FAD-dependent monooxygenase [Streptomyces sp. RB110-2]|nr:FAD-dependent monooxygenase [Streptomyces sp. RB110-2]MBK0384594.1 FAD-dependent monooxygenase [Streptomyces sp. RB110-2]
MIAADGSRSPVRDLLSIGSHGRGTLTNLVSFFFDADLEEPLRGRKIIAAYVNNPQVRGTIIPLDNDRKWVINVSFFPDKGQSAEDFTPERCVELVRAAVGVPDLELTLDSVDMPAWDISARVADTFARGRFLVAGDAAHVMPPTGAFGASTGIQDALQPGLEARPRAGGQGRARAARELRRGTPPGRGGDRPAGDAAVSRSARASSSRTSPRTWSTR